MLCLPLAAPAAIGVAQLGLESLCNLSQPFFVIVVDHDQGVLSVEGQ